MALLVGLGSFALNKEGTKRSVPFQHGGRCVRTVRVSGLLNRRCLGAPRLVFDAIVAAVPCRVWWKWARCGVWTRPLWCPECRWRTVPCPWPAAIVSTRPVLRLAGRRIRADRLRTPRPPHRVSVAGDGGVSTVLRLDQVSLIRSASQWPRSHPLHRWVVDAGHYTQWSATTATATTTTTTTTSTDDRRLTISRPFQ